MNNYKGFIDDLIAVLVRPQANFKIIKIEEDNQLQYRLLFDKVEKDRQYIHDSNEIRNFTDDILFGLQGKQALPSISIEGNLDGVKTREFIQSLFTKVEKIENRNYLFDIFYKDIANEVLLKSILSTYDHNIDDKEVVGQIVSYLLKKEIDNPSKEIASLYEYLMVLKLGDNYDYENYKPEVLNLLKTYKPYINDCYDDNGNLKGMISFNARKAVEKIISLKEAPANYHEYSDYLPIAHIKNKPEEKLFEVSSYQVYSFDLSFVNLIQTNETLISYSKVEDMVQTIIKVINQYLDNNDFKGLQKIGQNKDYTEEDYKTNIWFRIKNDVTDMQDSIVGGQYLIEQLAKQYNRAILDDDANISIDQKLAKSVHKFTLDCIIPSKAENITKKMKI